MADDFGGRDSPEPGAGLEVPLAGEAEQKAGRVGITGAGGVDDLTHRLRIEGVNGAVGNNNGAFFRTRQCRHLTMVANPLHCLGKGMDLVERDDLVLVGEQDIDVLFDEANEVGAMAIDAEWIRQAEGDAPAGAMSDSGRFLEGFLRLWSIPQVAFEVGHLGAGNQVRVDVFRPDLCAGAEKGLQGAMGVGRDQNEAASGGWAGAGGKSVENDSKRADVVAEDRAELIVRDLADETAFAAEGGERGNRVGCGAAGYLDARSHPGIKRLGRFGFDQRHGSLVETVLVKERVVGMGQHIDNGIADANHLTALRRHRSNLCCDEKRNTRGRSIAAGPERTTSAMGPGATRRTLLTFLAGAKKGPTVAHSEEGILILLAAFAKAFAQLTDLDTRRVIWISIALAIVIFIALWALVGYVLLGTTLFQIGWLEAAIDLLGGLAALVITWLLFPAVLSACIGLFLDRIVDAVERKHYPLLPPVRHIPVREIVINTLRFLGVLIVCNLVILVFLPFPIFFPFVFYAVNGYLLGREYFELVALRRADVAEVRALRDVYRGRLFVAGVLVALLLTVPIVNLVAPIVGAAAMVHLFVAWRQRDVGHVNAAQNA